jgi:hypothetical protein
MDAYASMNHVCATCVCACMYTCTTPPYTPLPILKMQSKTVARTSEQNRSPVKAGNVTSVHPVPHGRAQHTSIRVCPRGGVGEELPPLARGILRLCWRGSVPTQQHAIDKIPNPGVDQVLPRLHRVRGELCRVYFVPGDNSIQKQNTVPNDI